MVPVPKVNPPSSIHNDLRPISLLPTLAKVFESIVGKLLLTFLEPNFDDNQFGSREGRSTTHAIVALLHSWMPCLDAGVQSVLYLSIFVKPLTWSTTTYFSINSRSTTKLPSLFLMMPSLTPYDLPFPPTYANGHISATGDPIHFMFWDGGSKGAIYGSNKSKMVATAMLEKSQVAISPQPVVWSTSCFVLGWGFRGWRI